MGNQGSQITAYSFLLCQSSKCARWFAKTMLSSPTRQGPRTLIFSLLVTEPEKKNTTACYVQEYCFVGINTVKSNTTTFLTQSTRNDLLFLWLKAIKLHSYALEYLPGMILYYSLFTYAALSHLHNTKSLTVSDHKAPQSPFFSSICTLS